MKIRVKKIILPVIVICQFCCTSLWFASNGIMEDLIDYFDLGQGALGHLTSAVQLGFISGTLIFALLTVADRFPPSKVFFYSALIGAVFNLATILSINGLLSLLLLRFMTGFFLAGIYPVGMKIAADYFDKSLGKSLGFLVGALVIGTAFPHLIKGIGSVLPWKSVVIYTTILAAIGGILMIILVPNGPHRKASQTIDLSAFFKVFQNRNFRSAAFGYFGHMWELYAFWAFVPVFLTAFASTNLVATFNVPILSFLIIGAGGIACIIGGYLSQKVGTKKTAFLALLLSCLCCIVSPLIFLFGSVPVFLGFLLVWGMVVIADSPLFSTMVAHNAPPESKGTALTIVNCIGFAITIISIQLLNFISTTVDPHFLFIALALGPIIGLFALARSKNNVNSRLDVQSP